MTRVTDSMLYTSMRTQITTNQERVFEAQRRAETGLRVQRPGDDPVSATRGTVLESAQQRLESMGRTADRAEAQLAASEGALGQAGNLLSRVREIVVQASNETYSAAERAEMANEVASIRAGLVALGNQQVEGVYVFGGFLTDSAPFQADGTYTGDGGTREVEVAPGVSVGMNVPGSDVFAPAGGQDVFALLNTLETDLQANDVAAVRASIDNIEAGREQVVEARATFGRRLLTLEQAAETRTQGELDVASGLKSAVGVDLTESIVDLLEAQNALDGALSFSSRLLRDLSNSPLI